jgi:hypothetical protein
VKLTELNPRWAIDADIVVGGGQVVHNAHRTGMAITFDCPHCRTVRLAVFFANPVDAGLPSDDHRLWHRSGTTFEDLSLTPSIDASESGHWHGYITNGKVS